MVGIGILAAFGTGGFGAFESETVEFTFPATDGKGTMRYRCEVSGTREDSMGNARAAHAFFEPAMLKRPAQNLQRCFWRGAVQDLNGARAPPLSDVSGQRRSALESARLQAKAMLASMSQDRDSPAVSAELELVNAEAEKL